jgi:hypothetical protein
MNLLVLILSAVVLTVGAAIGLFVALIIVGTKMEEHRMKKATVGLKPGQKCPTSGQYRNSHTEKQCTAVKGERLPPGPKGSRWKLTDPTRHVSP